MVSVHKIEGIERRLVVPESNPALLSSLAERGEIIYG
jgi:hypothetical protein